MTYSDIIIYNLMAQWRGEDHKENASMLSIAGHLWGESSNDCRVHCAKGQYHAKCFLASCPHRIMFGITCMWNMLWSIHYKMWWSSGIFHKLFPLDDPKGSQPLSLSTGFMPVLWIVTAFASFCLLLWMLWIVNTIWSWCFIRKLILFMLIC